MKVKDLKFILDGFDENLEVVIGDYEEAQDEDSIVFKNITGVEMTTSSDKGEIVSIYFYD